MKAATIQPMGVADEFKLAAAAVLVQGESRSETVDSAGGKTVLTRMHQAEFVARGSAAINEAKRSGNFVPAEAVVDKLKAKLVAARLCQS
jgi:hypothetical protein